MQQHDLLEFDRAHPGPAVAEADAAEDNLNIVLAAAKRTHALLSQLRNNGFQAAPIQSLASDLKAIFALFRREVQRGDPEFDFKGRRVASGHDRLPERFTTGSHPCLCPLTVFLQQVARGLGRIEIVFAETAQYGGGNAKEDWGHLKPLYKILITLGKSFQKPTPKPGSDLVVPNFWPGVAQCVLFHEHHSEYAVTSSAARYHFLSGMAIFSRQVRLAYIRRMRNECPPEVQRRIEEVENRSASVYHHFEDLTPKDHAWDAWQNPFASPQGTKVRVDGLGATFDPAGNYKPACMTDHLRYDMDKPRAAETREKKKKKRDAFPEDSCAEWELFVTKLHRLVLHHGRDHLTKASQCLHHQARRSKLGREHAFLFFNIGSGAKA